MPLALPRTQGLHFLCFGSTVEGRCGEFVRLRAGDVLVRTWDPAQETLCEGTGQTGAPVRSSYRPWPFARSTPPSPLLTRCGLHTAHRYLFLRGARRCSAAAAEEDLVSRVRGGQPLEGLGPYPEGNAHQRWRRLTRYVSDAALQRANVPVGARIAPGGELAAPAAAAGQARELAPGYAFLSPTMLLARQSRHPCAAAVASAPLVAALSGCRLQRILR